MSEPKSALLRVGVARNQADPGAKVRHVLIARWDQTCADALRVACERAFPACQVDLCSHGFDALDHLRQSEIDLLLLGLNFSDLDGVDLLDYVSDNHLAGRVVIATSRRDEHSLLALRSARFDGFLDTSVETIQSTVAALKAVAAGEDYISRSLRRYLIDRQADGVLAQKLTAAEINIFCVIGDGSTDVEAADVLGLSKSTVQTHRRNIMRKLGVSSSAKLVCEAIRLGVVRISAEGAVIRPGFQKKCASLGLTEERAGSTSPFLAARFLPTGST